ncbi:Glycine betaine/L-proline transport system permease protein ProW [Candidatus Syntrophocurvum alkaliphilum]|uniref:Glycine betaine/L-proline transport system permease protein ProW n=1 Tax=Candidatus Syntrophocurvum alkaliphilum TaxID=2293317 RepID=A0A6I6DC88_9FIRM|nr:proline/glycine betaine ABC transporter permease [Candidatus Syntrophocurvum alkaliphilum]QGT99034.1 Glycine betaine/L-proline transport system permease protein ProW [Candidatus Syntrophocurvum alkaliphilum]
MSRGWWETFQTEGIPRVPVGDWIDDGINYLQTEFGTAFDAIADGLEFILLYLQHGLSAIPPILFIIIFVLIAWYIVDKKVALFTALGLYLIYNMGLWGPTMQTLAMVGTAVLLCIIIGVPLGILAAKNQTAERIITPILDFMQTLPAFVYLLPAIFFFGLGVVPAVIATLIFAMPPIIRLTKLGIQQVPEELRELGKSFGSTFSQMLIKIELPLARSTIMAGINQCIMLSLSMVVIASMIGARGLGGEVWRGIQRLDIGTGFEAGLAIVIVAIILDRITQNLGNSQEE